MGLCLVVILEKIVFIPRFNTQNFKMERIVVGRRLGKVFDVGCVHMKMAPLSIFFAKRKLKNK
jgi:hypothetical protein